MGKAIRESFTGTRLGKSSKLGMLICEPRRKGLLLSVYVDDFKLAGKKQNIDPMWKVLVKEVDLGEPASFLDHVYWGVRNGSANQAKLLSTIAKNMCESRISARAKEKLLCSGKPDADIFSWSYDMEGHAKKCVERYCELANSTTQQFFYTVSTPCLDDHHFKEEELGSVGELSKLCSQTVLKCLYLARIGGPDILWSVNTLARAVTKWTRACGKRLALLISYTHHTSEYKQHCHVGNTAKQCRLGLFQDFVLAGDLEDSKSTSGGTLCFFGCHTFVPIGWMCKKQTSVSHSSTESEIISLDAGLRMDGIPALDLWDLFIEVLYSPSNQFTKPQERVQGDLDDTSSRKHTNSQTMSQIQYKDLELCNVDYVSSNVKSSHFSLKIMKQ